MPQAKTTRFCLTLCLTGMLMVSHLHAQTPVIAKRLGDVNATTLGQAPAQVNPGNESILSAEVDAVITQVNFDISDRVSKGDLLVALDKRDFQLRLAQARANLQAQQARITRGELRLKRAQELSQSSFISEDELVERSTDVDVLQADKKVEEVAVSTAQRELQKTQVVAPFEGVITQRVAQVGAFATRGSNLLTIVQLGDPRLIAQVSNGDVASVRESQNLIFRNENGEWPVAIVSISEVLNNRSRVQAVRLQFVDDAPLTGSTGYLVWERPENVVSANIVVRRAGKLGVFVLNNGQVEFYGLPRAEEGQPASVDLPSDVLIVVEGQQRLQDGDEVINNP